MAEETEKKVKNNDNFFGFNVKDALTGNMERVHLEKTLSDRKKSGFDEEFGKLLKKSILGD